MFLFILLVVLASVIVGSWIITFNVMAASGTFQEPVVTYNLYVAPVITFLTGALILFYINRKFSASDRKDDEIAELKAEAEKKKDADLDLWRMLYVKKQDEMLVTLKDVCLSLKMKMGEKEHDKYCTEVMEAIKAEVHNHFHGADGDVLIRGGRI